MVSVLYTFDRRFMWKTFEAIDRHVDAPSVALPLRSSARGRGGPIPEHDATVHTAADLDAVVTDLDPDVLVQNHRFEATVLEERPRVHDEYPVVHVRHGASVGRGEVHNTIRDLGDVVDLALAPGDHWARAYRQGMSEDTRVAVVGVPEADDLVGTDPPRERRVLYAPTNHNYGGGSYLETADHVLETVADTDYELLFRPHPMDRHEEPGKTVTERCRERIADLPNVVFDDADTPRESLLRADLLVSDYSGIVTEWLHSGRPLVQLTAVASGADLPHLGYQTAALAVDDLDGLYEEGYPPGVAARVEDALSDLGIPMDGRAGERAAEEVLACTR